MNNLKQKSYKAFAWDFAGKIVGQTVGFGISIFLARLLDPSDFGLLAMVSVIIAVAGVLTDMGLGISLVQRKDVSDEHYGTVFFFNIAVGLTLSLLLFFLAPLVGVFYHNQDLVPIARVMSALFLLNSIGGVLRVKLRRELEYGLTTRANLIAAIVSGVLGVFLAINGFGLWSLVFQSLLNPIIANIYLFSVYKWRPKLRFSKLALFELWGFGFRMFLSGLLDTIFTNIDSVIIGKLFSPAALGYYFRARSLNNYVVQYSSGSLMSVLFPAFSKVQHDIESFKSVVFKGYHLVNLAALGLTGFFFVTGADLIMLVFGDKWQPSINIFKLLIITAFAYPLSAVLVNIIAAAGNSKSFLRLEIIKKIFFALSFIFGFMWGIKGYLICNAIAYLIAIGFNVMFASRQLCVSQLWLYKISLPYFLIVLALSFLDWIGSSVFPLSHFNHLLCSGSIFIALYIIVLYLFRVEGLMFFKTEIRRILKI